MRSTATISEDGRYRYDLTRTWDSAGPLALWVMLNPSTADSEQDDPTIRRCIDFSKRQDMGGLVVVNLMAYRATRPADLPDDPEAAIGPDNEHYLLLHAARADLVVAAWGAPTPRCLRMARGMAGRLSMHADMYCLGITAGGHPRHPLYVRAAAPLILYRKAS